VRIEFQHLLPRTSLRPRWSSSGCRCDQDAVTEPIRDGAPAVDVVWMGFPCPTIYLRTLMSGPRRAGRLATPPCPRLAARPQRRCFDKLRRAPASGSFRAISCNGWSRPLMGKGRSRDRLFGEEQRQDTISERGGNFHAGEVTARVGFNGKARLKCGPLEPRNRSGVHYSAKSRKSPPCEI
jgi:hypothetical protein